MSTEPPNLQFTPGTPEWISRRQEASGRRPIDVQRMWGEGDGGWTGELEAGVNVLTADQAGEWPMKLTFKPERDSWWIVSCGVLMTGGGGWVFPYVQLSPGDHDGVAAASAGMTEPGSRMIARSFAVDRGETYEATLLASVEAGDWTYMRGSSQLWMEARGWPR